MTDASADALSVREARDAYLAENGFDLAGYDAAWTDASFFGIPIAVPNTPAHRRALMAHDLHHVATGYGTDHVGEGEISAWEIGAGLRGTDLYVRSIVVVGALLGFVIAPARTLRAFRLGRRCRSLFEADYATVLDLSVAALRERLAVPADAVPTTRGLHARAPSVSVGL